MTDSFDDFYVLKHQIAKHGEVQDFPKCFCKNGLDRWCVLLRSSSDMALLPYLYVIQ